MTAAAPNENAGMVRPVPVPAPAVVVVAVGSSPGPPQLKAAFPFPSSDPDDDGGANDVVVAGVEAGAAPKINPPALKEGGAAFARGAVSSFFVASLLLLLLPENPVNPVNPVNRGLLVSLAVCVGTAGAVAGAEVGREKPVNVGIAELEATGAEPLLL